MNHSYPLELGVLVPPELGQIVSHYRLIDKIGEGGMGIVFSAEDTRLRRTVALKFLSPHRLVNEKERVRFQREAQASAALNHANICPIFDIGEDEGQTFLAMAYIEGQPLSTEILDGPMKLNEALEITIQIAAGLQAAHTKGVIHRDIKPQNVMVKRNASGEIHATIMDFGLARLSDRSELTAENTRLGTVAYMSPEQTQGTEFDHRTDLWSLGVVLYETIAGVTPFLGHYNQAIMFGVMNEEPQPITSLRVGVPIELDWILSKALAKDPGERYRSADDFILDLKKLKKRIQIDASGTQTGTFPASTWPTKQVDSGTLVAAGETIAQPLSVENPPAKPERNSRTPWLVAVGSALIAPIAIAVALIPDAPPPIVPLRRLDFQPPAGFASAVISPDGRYVAFSSLDATGPISVRDLSTGGDIRLASTSGGRSPFWAPGSTTLGFLLQSEIQTIDVPNGQPVQAVQLPSAPADFSAAWSPKGDEIIWSARYSEDGAPRLYTVNVRDGTPSPIVPTEDYSDRTVFSRPRFLPRADRVLMFLRGTPNKTEIIVRNLDTSEESIVGAGGDAAYSASGHIVYQTGPASTDTLWAVPFSLKSLKTTGEPFRVAREGAAPSVALDGTLCFSKAETTGQPYLAWRDRSGNVTDSIGQPQRDILYVSLSPNERYVAVRAVDASEEETDIWVHDAQRGLKTRITTDPLHDSRPIWTPDSQYIVFGTDRSGNYDVYRRRSDGSGEDEPLIATPVRETPLDWSLDGRYLLYNATALDSALDLWFAEFSAEGGVKSSPFLQTKFRERHGQFSPNGNYVAYASNRTGRDEVYIERFPEGGGVIKISANGGTQPRWNGDGTELYFVEGEALMAVKVVLGNAISIGQTTKLFTHSGLVGGSSPNYDVGPGGELFVVVENTAEQERSSIPIVQNWYAEFAN